MTIILLRVIAAYALAHLLVKERGPFAIFAYLRVLAGIINSRDADGNDMDRYSELSGFDPEVDDLPEQIATSEVGLMLLCMYCTGIWTNILALLIAPTPAVTNVLLEYLAACGIYFVLLKITEVLDGMESWFAHDQSPEP